mmetsp:Transcript_26172/g.46433  ORF Transcript_26172/g.46433 Transcript_26172/m.46433 type:complete len:220 (-) Transcript_26172:1198-1857(-)
MMRSGGNDPSSHGSKHREQEDEEWKPRSADVPVASAQGEKEDEDEGNDHANEHEDDEDDEGTEESTRIIIRGTNAVSVRSSSSISANTASSSTSTTSAAATATGSGEMSNMKLPFPWKLHTLLEDAEHAGQQDIVSWLPDGNGFKVHKPNEFCQVIMPKYFRQSKYESFTRQCKYFRTKRCMLAYERLFVTRNRTALSTHERESILLSSYSVHIRIFQD